MQPRSCGQASSLCSVLQAVALSSVAPTATRTLQTADHAHGAHAMATRPTAFKSSTPSRQWQSGTGTRGVARRGGVWATRSRCPRRRRRASLGGTVGRWGHRPRPATRRSARYRGLFFALVEQHPICPVTTYFVQQLGLEWGAGSEGKVLNGFLAQMSRAGPPLACGGKGPRKNCEICLV